ncbi:hypothetical protein GBA52_005442 [Prunus armeniaca]|nr:hypothetical protein GBA52_005442 [Prunus armeniaca]
MALTHTRSLVYILDVLIFQHFLCLSLSFALVCSLCSLFLVCSLCFSLSHLLSLSLLLFVLLQWLPSTASSARLRLLSSLLAGR